MTGRDDRPVLTMLQFKPRRIGSNNTAFEIPDRDATDISSTIHIADAGLVDSKSVTFAVNHTGLGDLIAILSHGSSTLHLMNQAGRNVSAPDGDRSDLSSAYLSRPACL